MRPRTHLPASKSSVVHLPSAALSPAVTRGGVAAALQRSVGNAAVARLVRSQEEAAARKVRAVLALPGRSLESALRAQAEAHLGADLSEVRVHDDAAADTAARSVQAEAFTSGSHVVFGAGAYDIDSAAGQRRVMHELAHVVQQQSGPVHGVAMAGGLHVSEPGDPYEQAADHVAERWRPDRSLQRHDGDAPKVD